MGNYPTSDLYYEKSVERRKAKFARAIRKIRGENRTGLKSLTNTSQIEICNIFHVTSAEIGCLKY